MRCPYCATDNEDSREFCTKCGEELPRNRGRWQGPETARPAGTPADVAAAHQEWDPAKRYAEPRTMSTYVPPADYTPRFSWIVSVLVLGIPATVIHTLLFRQEIYYPYHLGLAVAALTVCCLPADLLALLFAGRVRAKHTLGDDARAYRYSRLSGLFCWISAMVSLALYVVLFMRLMYNVGQFWDF